MLALDGYGLVDLGVRYQRGALEYALNINNLTDTAYFASALYDTQLYPGEPINVLATVRVRLRWCSPPRRPRGPRRFRLSTEATEITTKHQAAGTAPGTKHQGVFAWLDDRSPRG